MMTWKYCKSVLLNLLFIITSIEPLVQNNSWDYLIFTQHWPPTVCKVWMDENSSHRCTMPHNEDTWTIHGIWPSLIGNPNGPFFCNKTWLFDPEEVRPIETPLEQNWINIEAGSAVYDLWAHEWNKHGTCAAAIEPLNSQFKYFSQGLDWLQKYSMTKILEDSNILPSDNKEYTYQSIKGAVKAKLGVDVDIECKHHKGKQYLFELRLCVTKSLKLINCSDRTIFRYEMPTCSVKQGIIYPAKPENMIIVHLYRLVTLLQWLTL